MRKLTEKIEEKQQQQQQQKKTQVKKSLILSSDQLKRLNLKSGMNHIEFSVTNALQGTTIVEANIFFFDHLTKFVISDIDGTITKCVALRRKSTGFSSMFDHLDPMCLDTFSHWLAKIGLMKALPNSFEPFRKMDISLFISLHVPLVKVESHETSYEISNSVVMHCPKDLYSSHRIH